MDSTFFLGILVGLLLAFIFVKLLKPGGQNAREDRPEYIDFRKKWYFDDKTKVYITILVVIVVLLVLAYTMHDDTPGVYHK